MSFGSTLRKIGHQASKVGKKYLKATGANRAYNDTAGKGLKKLLGKKGNAVRNELGTAGAGLLVGGLGAGLGAGLGQKALNFGEGGGEGFNPSPLSGPLPQAPKFPVLEVAVITLLIYALVRKR